MSALSACLIFAAGRSELFRINSKLARILGEPPFILSAFFFGLALVIIYFGFGFYYARRRYTGVAITLFGLALGLSDGFATIGEGPLGWITWIIG